jgi:fatty acid desaturase
MQTFAASSTAASSGNNLSVRWTDLVTLTAGEKFIEITLSLPWLLASLWFYASGHWLSGALCSFYFFLTGLRQSHGAQHYSLGISRLGQDLLLFALSVLMLGSMHAVQASHLQHHRHCLEAEDTEGHVARQKWWRAVLTGPLFLARLHQTAWRIGNARQRRWIAAELLAIFSALFLAAWSGPGSAWHWHTIAMLTGECLTAFFAVWIVHHDTPNPSGRTQRDDWINWLSCNMFFHMEHHLFPAGPTPHLHLLAERLDEQANLQKAMVIGTGKCYLSATSQIVTHNHLARDFSDMTEAPQGGCTPQTGVLKYCQRLIREVAHCGTSWSR